ncbi:MAG: exodeoxyribonuclease III [Alphaproteobacteria bacterium]
MVTIATWNVNSVKARLPNVLEWLGSARPDIALLQELKCEAAGFPQAEIEDLGYSVAVAGQKSYNGVAILSRRPLAVTATALPGDPDDDQARYVEAEVGDLRVASIYLPNGNPTDGPKYPYKLAWMDRLRGHVEALLETEQAFVLGGDYNVIPADEDCYDPAAWADDALFRLDTRRRFRAILNLGVTEAYRALHTGGGAYSFWDYQRRAWDLDNGIRIDHHLLSPQAADRLEACEIDRMPRAKPKASDHTPVVVTLRDA